MYVQTIRTDRIILFAYSLASPHTSTSSLEVGVCRRALNVIGSDLVTSASRF